MASTLDSDNIYNLAFQVQCCLVKKVAEVTTTMQYTTLAFEDYLDLLLAKEYLCILRNFDATNPCLSDTELCGIINFVKNYCYDCCDDMPFTSGITSS